MSWVVFDFGGALAAIVGPYVLLPDVLLPG
jgi:hypothetical protein